MRHEPGLVATTTRIYPPDLPLLIDPDEAALRRAFDAHPVVVAGSVHGAKLGPPEQLERLFAVCDYALIEADGARRMRSRSALEEITSWGMRAFLRSKAPIFGASFRPRLCSGRSGSVNLGLSQLDFA
jgi:hypothetical protein